MEIILAVIGLLASFFFAGSEAAFTAFNKIRLDIWHKQQKRFIKSAFFFHEKPEAFFSTILIIVLLVVQTADKRAKCIYRYFLKNARRTASVG